jgi:hypothetical protein
MTDKQVFQLIAPIVVGFGFFLLALLLGRTTGDLNRYTWKALLASGGLLAYALYLTFWQNEMKELWAFSPALLVLGLLFSLLFPAWLFYWIWTVQTAARAEQVIIVKPNHPSGSPSAKIFRSVFLVWGVVNLLGLLIAIVRVFLKH